MTLIISIPVGRCPHPGEFSTSEALFSVTRVDYPTCNDSPFREMKPFNALKTNIRVL